MDVIRLLQSKNRCLERFLRLSNDFLRTAEQGELSGLQVFQEVRETHLRTLELYDRKISEIVNRMTRVERTPEIVERVTSALNEKENLVHQILATDLKIINLIEQEKRNVMTELARAQKSKELLGKFKSNRMAESGEGIDKTL